MSATSPPTQHTTPGEKPNAYRDVVECIRRVDGQTLVSYPDDSGKLVEGLTVCICTYKRPKSLCQFLDSLADHDMKPDRLVIVDASPGRSCQASVS